MYDEKDNLKKDKETEIVKRALRSTYDNLNDKLLRQTTREAIFAPENRMIEVGGRKMSASDLRCQIANTIENTGSSKTIEQAMDLQIMVANSLERINSETSSSQEYFRWLDDTTEILKHMNDGFVTAGDLAERNSFLDMSHQREAELMVCLGLYQSSKSPEAQEKAKTIRYKLNKLREMRQSIKSRTRNQVDVEISRAEYEMAIPHYKLYKTLAGLPFGYDINDHQKKSLGLNIDDEDDLEDGYTYYHNLLNVVLDQMREDDISYTSQEYQLAYDLAKEDNPARMKEISDKVKELSGRKNSFRVNYAIANSRETQTDF